MGCGKTLASVKGKKVVLLTTVHPPFDTRIFHKQAKTLVKAGYDVTLITQHDRNDVVDGVKILALPKQRNRLDRICGLTWRAFRLALRQRAEVYHFHDPELLPVGAVLKLLTRAKVIYDVHEDIPAQVLTKHWIPGPLRKPLAVAFHLFEKCLARALDAVVVATEGIAEKFRGLNPVVVHNYPDLEMLPVSSAAPRERDEKVLVYVGGLSKLRGAVEMVRSLEYLAHTDGLRLDLIGPFESPELERELQKLPGYKNVRALGWFQPPKVYKRLKEADIGLVCIHPVPRYVMALPTKLFEYMAAGLPVVASDFPLWREIVEGAGCGLLVNPLDPEDIARGVRYLLEHPEEARAMGRRGREAVMQRYNWEIEAEKLLQCYEELT